MADKVAVIAWLRKYAGAYTIPGVDNNELANWLAAAPAAAPLTREQIKDLIPDGDGWKFEVGFDEAIDFARAIERAHGIGQGKEASK